MDREGSFKPDALCLCFDLHLCVSMVLRTCINSEVMYKGIPVGVIRAGTEGSDAREAGFTQHFVRGWRLDWAAKLFAWVHLFISS